MNKHRPEMPDRTYRAHAGALAFDVVFKDGQLLLDGTPAAYTFEYVAEGYYLLLLDGRSFPVVIEPTRDGRQRVTLAGRTLDVLVKDERTLLLERFGMDQNQAAAEREVRAPMPGLVLRVLAAPGQQIRAGDGLLVLEAMKMENELRARADGVVDAIHVAPGDTVGKNTLLLEFEA